MLRRIEVLAEGSEGAALLCYERPPFSIARGNWCHRRMAASALERELGVEIPEYLAPGQAIGDSVPVGAGMRRLAGADAARSRMRGDAVTLGDITARITRLTVRARDAVGKSVFSKQEWTKPVKR